MTKELVEKLITICDLEYVRVFDFEIMKKYQFVPIEIKQDFLYILNSAIYQKLNEIE